MSWKICTVWNMDNKNRFLSTSINLDVQENDFIEVWSFLRNFCGAFAYKNYLPEFLY